VPLWEEYNKVRRKSQVIGDVGKCCGYKKQGEKENRIDLMEALAFVLLWIKREKRKKRF
jgi:hypothetical protein